MTYRSYDYRCPECGRQEEYLVELDEEGLPVAPMCGCSVNPIMERVYSPIRAVFGHGFFSHDRPRRVEVSYTDEDGKTHRQDITHKVDIGGGPGRFENDRDGKERF
jgi:predicted nucleic acid-binding Zn ribbon protein